MMYLRQQWAIYLFGEREATEHERLRKITTFLKELNLDDLWKRVVFTKPFFTASHDFFPEWKTNVVLNDIHCAS